MARYQEGVSVGSLLRESSLGGYVPPMYSNAWQALLREPERDLGGGRRLGPFGFSDADGARVLRSSVTDAGLQQQAWMSGLRPLKEGLYFGQREFEIFERGSQLRQLSNMSTDLLSYVNRARDARVERGLKAYTSLSRERESYINLPSNRASYSDLFRGQLPFQNPVSDLSSYMALASNLSSDQHRERLMSMYTRRLSPYDLLAQERSTYSVLTRDTNHMGPTQDISGLPQSSFSAYRKSRSRSPLGNRDLPSLFEVLGRCQSPYGRERSRFMSSTKVVSQHEVLEDSLSHVLQSVKGDGRIGDKQKMTGSVVRVDGLPAENKFGCISMLLDRLGNYGTVTDVQLQKESLVDYALFFYSEPDAAYVAIKEVQQNPLYIKSLKLSLWVMVADSDRPITLALTRVMYVENLDKGVTLEMLHKVCGEIGEVLDIELKETPPGRFLKTATVQYWKASHAQLAAETLNLTKIGKSIIKTTFGKNTPSNCVWIDGLPKDLSDRELTKHFEDYGHVDKYVFDRQREAALILYPARVPARQCVRYLENGKTALGGQIIRADYANDRAQLAFCKAMEQSGQDIGDFLYA